MGHEAHVRIDEGVKRGPRKARTPVAARSGKYRPRIPEERKAEILEAAITGTIEGQSADEIARRYGISAGTIRYWLLNDERAREARRALIDQELVRCWESLNEATDPLALAKAREEFRYWSWLAERRDAERYSHKQEITVGQPAELGEKLRRARERVIEAAANTTASSKSDQHAIALTPQIDARDGEL